MRFPIFPATTIKQKPETATKAEPPAPQQESKPEMPEISFLFLFICWLGGEKQKPSRVRGRGWRGEGIREFVIQPPPAHNGAARNNYGAEKKQREGDNGQVREKNGRQENAGSGAGRTTGRCSTSC